MDSVFVQVDGYRIHCLTAGEGPALVLLPGLLEWAARWAEFGYIDALASDYRVVAIDPLGVGESDRPVDPAAHDYASLIAQVIAALDAIEAESAHVWGYSAGGQIAAAFAQAHPARVRSLTAGGSVPVFLKPSAEQLEAQASALLADGWDGYWRAAPGPAPASTAAYRAIVEPRHEPQVFAARLLGMAAPFEAGGPYQGPKLCYAGSLEPWLEQARGAMPRLGARFEVIEGADHGGAFRDRHAVEPLVRRFLAEVASRPDPDALRDGRAAQAG